MAIFRIFKSIDAKILSGNNFSDFMKEMIGKIYYFWAHRDIIFTNLIENIQKEVS